MLETRNLPVNVAKALAGINRILAENGMVIRSINSDVDICCEVNFKDVDGHTQDFSFSETPFDRTTYVSWVPEPISWRIKDLVSRIASQKQYVANMEHELSELAQLELKGSVE